MSDTHSAVIVGREVAKAILATNAASALLKEYPECDGLRKELAEVSKRSATSGYSRLVMLLMISGFATAILMASRRN